MKPYIAPMLGIYVNLTAQQLCSLDMIILTYSNIEMATEKELNAHVERVNSSANKEDKIDFKEFKEYLINSYSQSLIDNTRDLVGYINRFQGN